MARLLDRNVPSVATKEELERLDVTWRRWSQAADALNDAEEAEEFQSVGLRCREALLSFVREGSPSTSVPESDPLPKLADFVAWSESIANEAAPGPGAEHLRSYLKKTAREAWDYVQWLTHYRNATRFDAEFAVRITEHVLLNYVGILVRHDRESPARCQNCESYRLSSHWHSDDDETYIEITVCNACAWEEPTGESFSLANTAPPTPQSPSQS